jgi:tetratricopeptide (TPR) repeat protein
MKCLEKDRNRRYETANGLAADLQRYLNSEPVQACPPSATYRLRTFVRRHRASLVTAALLLAIALVGGGVAAWQAIRAARAQEEAAEHRTAAIARDLETLNKANGLIEEARSHVESAEWSEADAKLTQATRLRSDHSSAWLARGELYARLGLWDLAAADFRRAWELQEPSATRAIYQHALLRACAGDVAGYRAACARLVRRLDNGAAVPSLAQEEDILRACVAGEEPPADTERLVELASRAVDASRSAPRLAALGTALYRSGRFDTAVGPLLEAKLADAAWEPAWSDAALALCYHRLGRAEEAGRSLQAAQDMASRGPAPGLPGSTPAAAWWQAAHVELLLREAFRLLRPAGKEWDHSAWIRRGDALTAIGRDREAVACFGRAVELEPDSDTALRRRAEASRRVHDWATLIGDYERIYALRPDLPASDNWLAWALSTCPDPAYRNPARAVALARKAVDLYPRSRSFWNTLAVALYRAGDWAGASDACLEALARSNARELSDWLVLAMAQWQLGHKERARRLLGSVAPWVPPNERTSEFLAEFRAEAGALIGEPESERRLATPGPPLDPEAYNVLVEIWPDSPFPQGLRGYLLADTGHYSEGADDLERAVTLSPERQGWWYSLAAARLAAGDRAGYARAREGMLAQFGETDDVGIANNVCYATIATPLGPGQGDVLTRLGNLALRTTPENPRVRAAVNYRAGRLDAALADLDRAAVVFTRRGWDFLFLAMIQHGLGREAEARESLRLAVEWTERANRTAGTGGYSRWMHWTEKAEVETVLDEARALIP